MRLWPELRPQPAGAAYSVPLPRLDLRGSLRGREERAGWRGKKGNGGEEKGREGH